MPSDLDGFDPLSADEPLDLDTIREDDARLDHLGAGGRPKPGDELEQLLAAWVAATRVHVVLTPPEAWPPRVHPTYHAWLDAPLPSEPAVDTFVLRVACMAAFLVCALVSLWAVLP